MTRNAISIGILELLWRVHRVAARRARMSVAEKLLQAGFRDTTLNSLRSERMASVVNRGSLDRCGLTDPPPSFPGGPVGEREDPRAALLPLSGPQVANPFTTNQQRPLT